MDARLSLILCALGIVVGVVITWMMARARQLAALAGAEAAALHTLTQLQIELSSTKERASRVSGLEQELESTKGALNTARERRATLESEVQRIPELEREKAINVQAIEKASELTAGLRTELSKLSAELNAERESVLALRKELGETKAAYLQKAATAESLTVEAAELRKSLTNEKESAQEKLAILLNAKQELTEQFKNLANEILEEKSKRFTDQNQTNLGALLDPLKRRITEFQSKVEESYVNESKDRSALGEQVRNLAVLNQNLSEDAKNLAKALRGSSKTQGSWGELILERVLEGSGLRKGEEYIVQESYVRDDGTRALPDVIVNLPEGRSLIIDSKVSLVAYEQFAISEAEDERSAASKRHIDSVKAHIKGLSGKNYQTLYKLNTLDFVVLFVPIEPAFMLAASAGGDLLMDAWKRNVLLVSPSTLLFVVRTVAHLWRQEAQSRNAQEIARRGAQLYDKFVGFIGDMDCLGTRLKQAQKGYDDAYSKLSTGSGHLVGQAEKLKELGLKPSKSLPVLLLKAAAEGVPLQSTQGLKATEEDALLATGVG